MNYVYKCPNCGAFDVRLEIGQHLDKCPTCGAPVTKAYQVAGIIYRGDGFYATSYNKDNNQSEV